MPSKDYEQHKAAMRQRQRRLAAAGRDIGRIPPVKHYRRLLAGTRSLERFAKLYFPHVFTKPWSPDHLRLIDSITRAVVRGELLAIAMPRGFGKSSLIRTAALWAVLTARRRYVVVVAANAAKAQDELETLKTIIITNDALADDFPEVIYPFRALEGAPQRQRGQTYQGQLTHVRWMNMRLVTATIPGSAAAGAVIAAAGLESSHLRGQNHQLPDGRNVRPDLVLIDDPQTRESALSASQTERRLALLNGDVLGMAGPGKKIAGLLACTVITKYDLADRILDRNLYPEWHGTKAALVKRWPTNQSLWDKYAEIRRSELAADGDGSQATEFYRQNREAMDQGAEVAWRENFTPPQISALQAAMDLRIRDEASFWAEYQNAPMDMDSDDETIAITPARIRANIAAFKPRQPHENAAALTAFIDVQLRALYWAVCSWSDQFSGRVIDWGIYPDQPARYHTYRNLNRTLNRAMPGKSLEHRLQTALDATAAIIFDQRRYDGHKISLCLVDANWGDSTQAVYEFAKRSKWPIMPSHGRYVSASSTPITRWRTKGRKGLNWMIPPARPRLPRHVTYDTNYWKSFIAARIHTERSQPGALTFPKGAYLDLIVDHLSAEKPTKVTARDRTIHEWKLPPSKPDNHWLDCIVGCAVAANICRIEPPNSPAAAAPNQPAASGTRTQRRRPRRRVTYLD